MKSIRYKSLGYFLAVCLTTSGIFSDGNQAPTQENKEPAKGPKNKKKDEISGIVKAIDLKVGTLTMTFTGDGKKGEQEYNLANKDMKVFSSLGLSLKLSDLVVGARIHVQLRDKDIIALRASHGIVLLSFISVDADKKRVTVRTERGSDTYQVADNARITINGKPGKLAEVPTNQRASVALSLDKKTILVLNVSKGPREGERKIVGREVKFTGVITKMDDALFTLTPGNEKGDRGGRFGFDRSTRIMLETDKDEMVKIEVDGIERQITRPILVEGKAADLKVGQRAIVSTDQGVRVLSITVLRTPKK